jgi:hypothetical protein
MTLTLTHLVAALIVLAAVLALLRWQGVFGSTLLRATAIVAVGLAAVRWIA